MSTNLYNDKTFNSNLFILELWYNICIWYNISAVRVSTIVESGQMYLHSQASIKMDNHKKHIYIVYCHFLGMLMFFSLAVIAKIKNFSVIKMYHIVILQWHFNIKIKYLKSNNHFTNALRQIFVEQSKIIIFC